MLVTSADKGAVRDGGPGRAMVARCRAAAPAYVQADLAVDADRDGGSRWCARLGR